MTFYLLIYSTNLHAIHILLCTEQFGMQSDTFQTKHSGGLFHIGSCQFMYVFDLSYNAGLPGRILPELIEISRQGLDE